MSEIINISFSKFAEYYKYCKLGMDINHQVEVTCRSPENHPKGCSWGVCNESDCPALRLNESMGKNRGGISMREILFRGKIIEMCQYQGKWIEGFYGVDDGKSLIAIRQTNGLNGFFCDPRTVGQYTGLKDKNGKKIFEGDIVRFTSDKNNLVVGFLEFSWQLRLPGRKFYRYRLDVNDNKRLEVIGNIYDNPELLEDEKNV